MFVLQDAVLGYIFTVLSYLIFFISRFCKEKKNLLILDILSKILIVISLFFLHSTTGMFTMGLLIIILILAKIKETYKKTQLQNRTHPSELCKHDDGWNHYPAPSRSA